MKVIAKRVLLASFVISVLLSMQATHGQDSNRTFKPATELMSDVLDLNDPILSIWPSINDLELESLSVAVTKLTEAYEADRLDSDERTREIQSMVATAKLDEAALKDMIKAAKDAKDNDEKKRLEDAKKFHETRRKYLERITKVREGERVLAESRIDYVIQLAYVLEMENQLKAARESSDVNERLATERELIRQSKELGDRLSSAASNLKKVNSERDKAFSEREKLIAAYR